MTDLEKDLMAAGLPRWGGHITLHALGMYFNVILKHGWNNVEPYAIQFDNTGLFKPLREEDDA